MLSTQRQSERAFSTTDAGASVTGDGIIGAADAEAAKPNNGAAVNIDKSTDFFMTISGSHLKGRHGLNEIGRVWFRVDKGHGRAEPEKYPCRKARGPPPSTRQIDDADP